MKNLFLLTSFMLFLISCGGNGASSPNSNVQSIDLTGFVVTDLPGGYQRVVKSNAEGKILEEGVLKNGKRNGTWVVYQDRKPTPKSIANFIDDQYSGVYMEFANTSQLELICSYKANQLDGKFIRLKNTRILEEGTYIDGQIDGNYKKFYPNKDVVQQENNYKMGKLHGKSNYYNEAGQLIMEYDYKDGEKISGGMVDVSKNAESGE